MYEARQNKEKVSRRIEVGGGARQMMKMENGRRTIIQLNRQIAKEYANTAKTIYDTITKVYTPDFASSNKLALTIAVNDSHFTYCGGGYAQSLFEGKSFDGRTFSVGKAFDTTKEGRHAELKLLNFFPSTKNLGVSREVCTDCRLKLKRKIVGDSIEDICSKDAFDTQYTFYSPTEYTPEKVS